MRTQILESNGAMFPVWSPDSKMLAYWLCRQQDGVAIINADGTGYRELNYGSGIHPEWSPDGKRLAYWGFYNGLSVMNLDGSNVIEMYKIGTVHSIAWSPNGKYIALCGDDRDLVKKLAVVSTEAPYNCVYFKETDASHLSWSPNSRLLMYACEGLVTVNIETKKETTQDGISACWSSQGDIAIYRPYGIDVTTQGGTKYAIKADFIDNMHWSADGTKLVFTGETWRSSGLFYAERGSSRVRLYLKGNKNAIAYPRLSPDKKMISIVEGGRIKILYL